MKETILKGGISGAAAALVLIHLVWPPLKVDAVTLGLLALAILPWLSALFESVELPGGFKVKYRTLKAAEEALKDTPAGLSSKPAVFLVNTDDPNLALVALRIEIEKRIRVLAERHDIAGKSLTALLRELRAGGHIDRRINDALIEFVQAGNRAAHGARVEPDVAEWAQREGPFILGYLDQMAG